MEWKEVKSSQIKEVGYTPATETLGIRFLPWKEGGPITEYWYSNVSRETYDAMMEAESIGKYFAAHMRSEAAKHPYVRVA